MEDFLLSLTNYISRVLISTFAQLFILFGPLLILSFIMHLVAGQNRKMSYQVIGRKAHLVLFGWLGTAVHEMGHAIFAILFGHSITKMKIFPDNPDDQELGKVSHAFNRSSIIQNIGNFFIGIGPIIFGSIMLFIITFLLFRFSTNDVAKLQIPENTFPSLSSLVTALLNLWNSFDAYIYLLMTSEYSSWWKIAILIYLLYAIGSSITLSQSDIRSARFGFLYFFILLIAFNLITLWIGDFIIQLFSRVSLYFSGFYFLIVLSILVNLVFILILYILGLIKKTKDGSVIDASPVE